MLDLNTPQNKQLATSAKDAFSDANALVVDSQDSYELAVEYIRGIKAVGNKIEEQRKTITAPLDKAKKAAMDFFRPYADACTTAESTLKAKCTTYQLAAQRARDEEAARLRAEAAKESVRLEIASENKLIEGDIEAAGELLIASEMVVAQTPAPTVVVPKVSGATTRDNWVFELTDLGALIKAAAENPAWISLLTVDESAARKLAGQVKDSISVPGLRIYNDKIMSVR